MSDQNQQIPLNKENAAHPELTEVAPVHGQDNGEQDYELEQFTKVQPKLETQLKNVMEQASRLHKSKLNDIYKDSSQKDQIGFKDSDIRKHHEAIRKWILDAFDKTFNELPKYKEFQNIIDSHRTKLGKTIEMQLLLCFRRQEITLEKLLMNVKLATCQAEEHFDSLEKPQEFESEDKFNEAFAKWKTETIDKFHGFLDENNIKHIESWNFELNDKLKEKKAQLKSTFRIQKAEELTNHIEQVSGAGSPKPQKEEQPVELNKVSDKENNSEQLNEDLVPNVDNKTAVVIPNSENPEKEELQEEQETEAFIQQGQHQENPNLGIVPTDESSPKVIPKSPVGNMNPTKFVVQQYPINNAKTVRSGGPLMNMVNDLECTDADVGIYLDSTHLLVGKYNRHARDEEKVEKLIDGKFFLDVTTKQLEIPPTAGNPNELIDVFHELVEKNTLGGTKKSSVFSPEQIAEAFLAAVAKKLKDSKYRANRVVLTMLSDIDGQLVEIITKAGNDKYGDIRVVPYQCAVVLGYYRNNLPNSVEKKIVVRVGNNNLEASTVSVCKIRVTREHPSTTALCKLDENGGILGLSKTIARKLELPPTGTQRVYLLEGNNLARPNLNLQKEDELRDVDVRIVDHLLQNVLHGVSFLAKEQEFQVIIKS